MVKRIGSRNTKTRHLKSKTHRTKGKLSITKYFAKFNDGDKVQLILEPAVHTGIFHKRFYGRVGKVCGKQGGCYFVKIKDINKFKNVLVHPIHLRGIQ